MSQSERTRAAERAKASPDAYELDHNGALAIRGEVLVTGLDAAGLARLEERGFSILRREDLPEVGITLAVVSREGMDADHAIRILRRIVPGATFAPNHVLFESGMGIRPSGDRTAVPGQERGTAATIGLVDTAVAANVKASPRIHLVQRGFAAGESRPADHGTAVAALLAREPGSVTIYAADIFGSGPRGGTSELLVRALGWMAGERIPVVNVSLVGPANPVVATAVAKLLTLGLTIVAPVGNDGRAARPLYPASYPGVVAVSGAERSGLLLPEASRVRRVDFVAPGIATVPDVSGHETEVRGTSFAAPIVARLIADHVHVPDPVAARRAIGLLASEAERPKVNRNWYGHGLLGMPAGGR